MTAPEPDVHDVYVHVVDTGPLLRRLARLEVLTAQIARAVITEGETVTDPEVLAQQFHETYERLAPSFGYETREASAKPWTEVPEQNRRLMTAVCAEILDTISEEATMTDPTPVPAPPAEPAV